MLDFLSNIKDTFEEYNDYLTDTNDTIKSGLEKIIDAFRNGDIMSKIQKYGG